VATAKAEAFFADLDYREVIRKVAERSNSQNLSMNPTGMSLRLASLLRFLVRDGAETDKSTRFSIDRIGAEFISLLRTKPDEPEGQVRLAQELFAYAYCFVCEFELTSGEEMPPDILEIHAFVDENMLTFPAAMRRRLIYAQYRMTAEVAKELVRHPNILKVHQMLDEVDKADEYKRLWQNEYTQEKTRLDAMDANLKELMHGYNFVGLTKGFESIAKKKEGEKKVAFGSMLALGASILLPILGELLLVICRPTYVKENAPVLLYSLPALITLEVVLVYFFRVVLAQFRSVRAQILQLELRMSLCQFIQSYADYADELKKKSATTLDRFESVVFSGLLATEEQLPATFDGMEQLISAAKAIKG
jgi:hypothetical protein